MTGSHEQKEAGIVTGIVARSRATIERRTVRRRPDGSYLVKRGRGLARVYHVDAATKDLYVRWVFRRDLWVSLFGIGLALLGIGITLPICATVVYRAYGLWSGTYVPVRYEPIGLFLPAAWMCISCIFFFLSARPCPHLRGCATVSLREWQLLDL